MQQAPIIFVSMQNTQNESAPSQESRGHQPLFEMPSPKSYQNLTLLGNLKEPYEEMHQMVDEMIHQRMKQNIGQIKDIPKEDKEEQKEPELMK